ncbi:endonuclease III [Patescibacteria group bacterium]|nr:endonuclease III [Patescibacteria group bacterium]
MLKTNELSAILTKLRKAYPHSSPPLNHRNAFELLISVILSAQCTDERVNQVTKTLFPEKTACTPEHILKLGEKRVKEIIHPTGYFNSKTKSVMGVAKALKYHEVPSNLEELTALPGVGRKTAQVVQAQWFHIPALPVDTHVHRVANRIGLVQTDQNRDKTERELKKIIPENKWIKLHFELIYHGRTICTARSPKCSSCPIFKECRWPKKTTF